MIACHFVCHDTSAIIHIVSRGSERQGNKRGSFLPPKTGPIAPCWSCSCKNSKGTLSRDRVYLSFHRAYKKSNKMASEIFGPHCWNPINRFIIHSKYSPVLSSCTGSQEPKQKTKQYTTTKQRLQNKERTMVIPLWTGTPEQNLFPLFWLVKTIHIIHYNQLLLTKFEKNLCHIESVRSKVQRTAD